MELYSEQNTRDATRLLYSSHSKIACEVRRQEPCFRKLLGYLYTFEQVSDWIYFHSQQNSQHSSHPRQETRPDVLEESVNSEATRKIPELCSTSTKTKPISGTVTSEEDISKNDESDGYSDTSSEDSNSSLTSDEEGLDIEQDREAGSLWSEALEDSFLNMPTDIDVGLSLPKLSTEAKNGYVNDIDRVWA